MFYYRTNHIKSNRKCVIIRLIAMLGVALTSAIADSDWWTFRGSLGTGESAARRVPVRFGTGQNVAWMSTVPPGASSPIATGGSVFLTGSDADKVYTMALDAKTGKQLWRRDLDRPRKVKGHQLNTPASPTPVTDGKSLFVYFGEVGLIRYSLKGKEQWRVPLDWRAPTWGYSSSPLLAGSCVVVFNDGEGSHGLFAYSKHDGKVCWKDERKDISGTSYSTPAVGRFGKQTILVVPTSFQTHAYDAETGQRLWWVGGCRSSQRERL